MDTSTEGRKSRPEGRTTTPEPEEHNVIGAQARPNNFRTIDTVPTPVPICNNSKGAAKAPKLSIAPSSKGESQCTDRDLESESPTAVSLELEQQSPPVFLLDSAPAMMSPRERGSSSSSDDSCSMSASPSYSSSRAPTSSISSGSSSSSSHSVPPMSSPTSTSTSTATDFMAVPDAHNKLAHMVTSEPFEYLNENKGKGMRNLLMDAFNLWYKAPKEKLDVLKSAVDQLHIASLLVDDIEDDSTMRRGAPVAHKIYGVPLTINSSNYRIFTAFSDVNNLGSQEASSVFLKELVALHQGQGMDIFWRDRNECPTEEDYTYMVLNKTGGLFRLAGGLVRAFRTTSTDVDVTTISNLLGAFYQVRDDLISLTDDSHMKKKVFCEDIGEGKFSFCIIHSIRNSPASSNQLLNILKMRTDDVDIKKQALRVMEESGSFEYTRRELAKIKRRIDVELKRLGGNPIIELMVAKLSANLHLEKLEAMYRLNGEKMESEDEGEGEGEQ